MKSNNEKIAEKADALVKEAECVWNEINELKEKINILEKRRADLMAEAAELILPFRRGDTVEYLEKQYSRQNKTKKIRMRVVRFYVRNGEINVYGVQINKNNETAGAWGIRKEFTISEHENPFIRIVEQKK